MNNTEIRELTAQERENYTFCPCCKSRIKPQTFDEKIAAIMHGLNLARERDKKNDIPSS
jgi:hypothetical protein